MMLLYRVPFPGHDKKQIEAQRTAPRQGAPSATRVKPEPLDLRFIFAFGSAT